MNSLNPEEKELLESVEQGEWQSIQNFSEEIKRYQSYANQQIKTEHSHNKSMKVTTKKDLVTLLQQHQDFLRRLGVRGCGLFGSFVKDQVNDESDVDLLVIFDPNLKTFDNFMNLSIFLEDLLERKVDLVTLESLSPYIGNKILNEVEYVPLS